jgi:hypothetical protein
MKTIRQWILVLFSTLMLLPSAKAQTVYAQVSSKRVQVGVPFEYAIVISVSANNYTPPNFKDFDIVSGPNQSSSVQYVNGAITQQMVISFGLMARKEGKYTIGPAYVTANGQRYETSSMAIEVTKSGAQGGGEQRGGSSGVTGEDLFIKTTVSKNKVYLGEQITIVQKVYSRNQIIGYQKSNPPAYDGFYSQAQDSPTKGQLIMENVDGVNYYTHEIFRTVATANKTGKIALNPIELTPIIRKQSASRPKSIFEQFFGGASYEDVPVPIKSRAQVIEVMDLPEDGRPESFNGAVGNFLMRTEVSRTTLKANEAFNLKLIISGKGNLKLINPPKLRLPESFESYDPRVSDNLNSKTFDYLIIPRQEGSYKLDDLEFSYFNLDTKKYVVNPSPQIDITVLPPDASGAGAQVYTPRNQVKETENDIRYIKKGDFLLIKTRDEFFNSPLHLGLLAFPVAALFGGWYARRSHIRNNSNLALVRERKAGGAARRQLRQAEKLKTQGNKDGFYAEVLTALNNYLSHKLNIPVADLSRERIFNSLKHKHVKDETRATLEKTLDTAEYARYAPGAVSGDLDAVYSDIVKLVTTLEQQLNRKAS